MDFTVIFGMLFTLAITTCGLILIGFGLYHRGRMREFAHRERLAMIEKGLDPSFVGVSQPSTQHGPRARSAGIMLIGLGLAIMVLITFAGGNPAAGFGVGGAIVVLGLTFLLNSVFSGREGSSTPPDAARTTASPSQSPPSAPPPSGPSGQTT